MPVRTLVATLYPVMLAGIFFAAAPPASGQISKDTLTVVDFSSKEHQITGWKFTTGTRHLNWLATDEEEDLKDFGKAESKFLGGAAQGVKKITFSAPVPLAALPKGRPAQVTTTDKNNKSFVAVDLLPLYQQFPGQVLHLDPTLHFQ